MLLLICSWCTEFGLIVNVDGVYKTFLENWEKWKSAIVEYSRANTPMLLKQALEDLVSEDIQVCFHQLTFYNYNYYLNYTVQYKTGATHQNADGLSRQARSTTENIA